MFDRVMESAGGYAIEASLKNNVASGQRVERLLEWNSVVSPPSSEGAIRHRAEPFGIDLGSLDAKAHSAIPLKGKEWLRSLGKATVESERYTRCDDQRCSVRMEVAGQRFTCAYQVARPSSQV